MTVDQPAYHSRYAHQQSDPYKAGCPHLIACKRITPVYVEPKEQVRKRCNDPRGYGEGKVEVYDWVEENGKRWVVVLPHC